MGDMEHQAVYDLSKAFGPPKTDVRQGKIEDYGEQCRCSHIVNHQVPEDVTHEDLDYYPDHWAFMDFGDLLFYLYPVALECEKDYESDCTYWYLMNLDMQLKPGGEFNRRDQLEQLSPEHRQAFREGLLWMFNAWEWNADWVNCKHLQAEIGVHLTEEDIDAHWAAEKPAAEGD
jgi:hypothetical protein